MMILMETKAQGCGTQYKMLCYFFDLVVVCLLRNCHQRIRCDETEMTGTCEFVVNFVRSILFC